MFFVFLKRSLEFLLNRAFKLKLYILTGLKPSPYVKYLNFLCALQRGLKALLYRRKNKVNSPTQMKVLPVKLWPLFYAHTFTAVNQYYQNIPRCISSRIESASLLHSWLPGNTIKRVCFLMPESYLHVVQIFRGDLQHVYSHHEYMNTKVAHQMTVYLPKHLLHPSNDLVKRSPS